MEQNTQNTALLVMDMQESFIGRFPSAEAIVGNVKKAIDAAREHKIPVIYVVVGFRQGGPEISMNHKTFSAWKERAATMDMAAFMKIHDDVAPLPGEVIITKRRVSAFTGSDLEVVLRAQGIQHVVLTGIATSGVVLSTTNEATDKDYRVTILSDGCADGDEEVHNVLMTKIFARHSDVVTADEWCNSL